MTHFKKLKRRVNFILINWVKYYTKEAAKTLKLVTIGSAIVLTVVCVKYKPAYKVTISGETIGFVNNKEKIERKIDQYINDTSGNIAYRKIDVMPEYELKLINRDKAIEEKAVILAVENATTTTYRAFAVTSDGEQKVIVATQEEAESIINDIKNGLAPEVDLKLGIIDVYSTELKVDSKDVAMNTLNDFKVAKVTEYETKKAEEEKIAKQKAQKELAQKRAKRMTFATSTTINSAPSGNLNGLALSTPVSGSISSRFGSRSSVRSSSHTGIDIASSAGTGIRAIAPGTVSFAAYKGTYGNLVIVDHGNGVQSYYAHCSALYVSPGQSVGPNTTIATVGSKGNSTGPHLHLEIRINGSPVNPQNYLY